jgi:hypothetical protein
MVINAIPFGPRSHQIVEAFAARVNPAFYPKPQGARTTITVEEDYPAAFDTFRAIQNRTGKNFAAFAGDYHAAMCAAIRAGWRSGYTAATELGTGTDINGRELQPVRRHDSCRREWHQDAEKVIRQIRQARAAPKISRGFDLQPMPRPLFPPQVLPNTLEGLKDRGHVPQLIYPGPFAEGLDGMAATASHYQVTPVSASAGSPQKPCAPSPKPWPEG